MVRGIYTAASGLLNTTRIINVRSNNMANLSTAGFKEDRVISSTFKERIALKQDVPVIGSKDRIGSVVRGVAAVETETNFAQGGVEETFRSVDIAIVGDGFFTFQHPDGENLYYSRNGQFQIDPDGYLINGLGHHLLDETESLIPVYDANFTVDASGMIYGSDGEEIARMGITAFDDNSLLYKNNEETFMLSEFEDYQPEQVPFTGTVRQGYIETSNTDVTEQMAGLISNSRSYQAMSSILKAIDAALGKSIAEVGRV